MFKKMPGIISFLILILLLGPYLPLPVKEAFYAISLTLKSGILSLLPLIIFGLLFRATVLMAGKATWIAGLMLVGTAVSTFAAVFLARFVGLGLYQSDMAMSLPPASGVLNPLWDGNFDLGLLLGISNSRVMMAAVGLGLLGAFRFPDFALRWSKKLDDLVSKILSWISWMIPPFVAGFLIKLQCEGAISIIAQRYSVVFLTIALAQFLYLGAVYLALSGFSLRRFFTLIGHMMPAVISGFTTMSSAASMPVLIQGIENNTQHKQLAKVVAPALVNIHWVGECFADVILAYAVIKTFGLSAPDFWTYVLFSVDFFLLRFSCAAIPGGGIVIIQPLLRKYFHFNEDMIGLITALYILFDPILTVGNLLGDGALAQCIDKIVTKFPRIAYSKKEIALAFARQEEDV